MRLPPDRARQPGDSGPLEEVTVHIKPLHLRGRAPKSRGQSLVEFVVILPILLIMLSGLIEFGFMINYYLDVIDAARDGARFASNLDPLAPDDGIFDCVNSGYFYRLVPCVVNQALAPQITLDPSDPPPGDSDDMVISAFSVAGTTITQRFPDADGWSLNSQHASEFTTAEVQTMLSGLAGTTPSTGVVLVEVFFDYHMVLALPWITAFVPNPVTLHAYTLMPNTFVEPTPTP